MLIGEIASRSGVSAKMIRYYESIGLLPEAARHASGYRDYGDEDLHRLGFIRRARDLGFSIGQITDLLRLWTDKARSNAEVKLLVSRHVSDLDRRSLQLEQMANALRRLADACHGDGRPDCPILDGLERSG